MDNQDEISAEQIEILNKDKINNQQSYPEHWRFKCDIGNQTCALVDHSSNILLFRLESSQSEETPAKVSLVAQTKRRDEISKVHGLLLNKDYKQSTSSQSKANLYQSVFAMSIRLTDWTCALIKNADVIMQKQERDILIKKKKEEKKKIRQLIKKEKDQNQSDDEDEDDDEEEDNEEEEQEYEDGEVYKDENGIDQIEWEFSEQDQDEQEQGEDKNQIKMSKLTRFKEKSINLKVSSITKDDARISEWVLYAVKWDKKNIQNKIKDEEKQEGDEKIKKEDKEQQEGEEKIKKEDKERKEEEYLNQNEYLNQQLIQDDHAQQLSHPLQRDMQDLKKALNRSEENIKIVLDQTKWIKDLEPGQKTSELALKGEINKLRTDIIKRIEELNQKQQAQYSQEIQRDSELMHLIKEIKIDNEKKAEEMQIVLQMFPQKVGEMIREAVIKVGSERLAMEKEREKEQANAANTHQVIKENQDKKQDEEKDDDEEEEDEEQEDEEEENEEEEIQQHQQDQISQIPMINPTYQQIQQPPFIIAQNYPESIINPILQNPMLNYNLIMQTQHNSGQQLPLGVSNQTPSFTFVQPQHLQTQFSAKQKNYSNSQERLSKKGFKTSLHQSPTNIKGAKLEGGLGSK
ncbi:MAG: hypothetical protein EZS28_015208 [Streblomastix strix]|uniref:Uncharacterized protein n=1 Tax=Streblomastix strix TaxID=222440 RepID=A0A5J4W423_9EUKA|nr:MAG: hypothetical protein EZS28_015208 [Streblomastix strix]